MNYILEAIEHKIFYIMYLRVLEPGAPEVPGAPVTPGPVPGGQTAKKYKIFF